MSLYPWVLAGHVIAIIAWMAGLLYLPRLFVYHADAEPGSVQSDTFKTMERRLLKAIMTPAMVAAWVFGLAMLVMAGFSQFASGWMWVKAAMVIGLSGIHGVFSGHVRRFADDANQKPARHFRVLNEIPTLIMVVIVVMVIVKPL